MFTFSQSEATIPHGRMFS